MTMRDVFSGLLVLAEIISFIYVSPFRKKKFLESALTNKQKQETQDHDITE